MINIINKIFERKLRVKSNRHGNPFTLFGSNRNEFIFGAHLSPTESLRFYGGVAPVNLSINKIVDQSETIPPVAQDANGKIISHPVIELLKNPNADKTQNEFMREIGIHYAVTGNAYIVATGNINEAPLELFIVNPANVSLSASSFDQFADTITVNSGDGGIVFTRRPGFNIFNSKRIRFVADGNKELWHIKNFNPLADSLEGMSPLQPITAEIQQYVNASKHNNSLLRRGATISGIFSLEDNEAQLTHAQQDQLRLQIKHFYTGVDNAGVAFLASKLKFQAITQSNRDMDFGELKESVMQMIVNVLKIPLPLVVSDNMAFNNVDNATLALYDNAVIPLTNRIFNELSLFLLPRYADSEGSQITFLLNELPALEPRRNAEINKIKDLDVLTIDEVRQEIGREPLKSGGDQLYIAANLVPVGEDNFTEDQPDEPVAPNPKAINSIQDCNGEHFATNFDKSPDCNVEHFATNFDKSFDKSEDNIAYGSCQKDAPPR